jgi:hypothetical protein
MKQQREEMYPWICNYSVEYVHADVGVLFWLVGKIVKTVPTVWLEWSVLVDVFT